MFLPRTQCYLGKGRSSQRRELDERGWREEVPCLVEDDPALLLMQIASNASCYFASMHLYGISTVVSSSRSPTQRHGLRVIMQKLI